MRPKPLGAGKLGVWGPFTGSVGVHRVSPVYTQVAHGVRGTLCVPSNMVHAQVLLSLGLNQQVALHVNASGEECVCAHTQTCTHARQCSMRVCSPCGCVCLWVCVGSSVFCALTGGAVGTPAP